MIQLILAELVGKDKVKLEAEQTMNPAGKAARQYCENSSTVV